MASPDLVWSEYSPSMAENGKFVKLDMTDIPEYTNLAASSALSGISTGQRFAVLTYATNSDEVASASLGNSLWIGTSSVAGVSLYSTSLPSGIKQVEIQNKTAGNIYILASSTSFDNVTSKGIELATNIYYSLEQEISNLSIASLSAGTLRLIGYYRI